MMEKEIQTVAECYCSLGTMHHAAWCPADRQMKRNCPSERRKMAIPLKEGTHIYVEHKNFKSGYAMPSMEMATDHYSIGYVISGDRKTITPTGTYSYHTGDVAMAPPFAYHRTVAESEKPYERILIKFSPDFVEPFIQEVGQMVIDSLYAGHICHFSETSGMKVRRMFYDMAEEYEKGGPYREFILQGMLFRLLLTVWEEREQGKEPACRETPLTPPVMDAIFYIENSYMKNPSLEEAAKTANFSAAYFSRMFHTQLGMSYSEYLDNVKIRHVQILLTQTDKTIMEIAQETGYCHGNYLSGQFKKKVGMTPGMYRKMQKKAETLREMRHQPEEKEKEREETV